MDQIVNLQENTEENGKITGRDARTGRFLEGNPGGGRPSGRKNYSTLFDEAISRISALDPSVRKEDLEVELIQTAILKAKGGDFRFYKDIMDRLYGSAPEMIPPEGGLFSQTRLEIVVADNKERP